MATKKKNNNLKWLFIALGVLIVAGAIGKKAGWIGGKKLDKVAVEETTSRSIVQMVLANGKIMPETEVKISPEISGEVIALYIEEGDSVKKGQLLCKINPEILEAGLNRTVAALNGSKANLKNSEARLAQMRASFTNIEQNYKRNKKLFEQKVISEAEFQNSETAYLAGLQDIKAAEEVVSGAQYSVKSSEANLRETNENLNRTSIYSPIDGKVTKLDIELGEKVVGTAQMAGSDMMHISNLNLMQAQVDVSETDIVSVSIGDTASVEVDAYPGMKFKGIVREIGNSANSSLAGLSDQVTNFSVKIDLLNASYANVGRQPFRPGMSCSVEIQTDLAQGVLAVPIEAVTAKVLNSKGKVSKKYDTSSAKSKDDDDTNKTKKDEPVEIVFVADKTGKVSSVKVKTGIQDDTYIQILEGLNKGDKVIIAPFSAISSGLFDDQNVEVVDKHKFYSDNK